MLGVSLAFRHYQAAFVSLAAILVTLALRHSGSWYAGHAVVDFVVVIAAASVAVLTRPESLRHRTLSPRVIALLGVALPVYVFQIHTNPTIASGDTQPVVPTVQRMLHHGDRDLTPFVPRWSRYAIDGNLYFLRAIDGGLYSAYPAGMEVFALPVVLLLEDRVPFERLERIAASLLCAATLALFFLLATHFASTPTAYLATLLLATGSTFASCTGMALWQQSGVAFWIVVALLAELKHRPWLQALACAMMLACRPSAITFLIPMGLYVLIHDRRRGVFLPLMALLCYLPWAVLYQNLYGSPFGPSMGFLNEPWSPLANLDGVLFSPARGPLRPINPGWCYCSSYDRRTRGAE